MQNEMIKKVEFIGLNYTINSENALVRIITDLPAGEFKYLVTPNSHHISQIFKNKDLYMNYTKADFILNDSKIVKYLAAFFGKDIGWMPGSDLCHRILLACSQSKGKIGVVGPNHSEFCRLANRFPDVNLIFIAAPMGLMSDNTKRKEVINACLSADCDILFLCLGFPLQEFIAHEIKNSERSRGIALCLGASVDFLIGKERRAPPFVQKLAMEWLFRLIQNPRRLWRRYLIESPVTVLIVLKFWLKSKSSRESNE